MLKQNHIIPVLAIALSLGLFPGSRCLAQSNRLIATSRISKFPVDTSRPVSPRTVALRSNQLFQPLSDTALEVAADMGVIDQIEELAEARSLVKDPKLRQRDVGILSLRLELTETLMQVVLESREAETQLDMEITEANDLRGFLENKRDKAIRLNNIANFVSGGALAMVASSIQIGTNNSFQNTGNTIEVAAGALSAGISAYALHLIAGPKLKSTFEPNMLALVFNMPEKFSGHYPEIISAYLNDPIKPGGPTRREVLINGWLKMHLISSVTSKPGMKRLRQLSGCGDEKDYVTIAILQDRAAMLNDLRSAIMQVNADLTEIIHFIRKV